MAQIQFPALVAAHITQVTLGVEYPGQVVISSPQSMRADILNFNHGRWVGQIQIGTVDDHDALIAQTLESFLGLMQGRANEAQIPHHRPTIPNTIIITGQSATAPYQLQVSAGIDPDVQVGMMLEINDRTYMIGEIVRVAGSDDSITLTTGAVVSTVFPVNANAISSITARITAPSISSTRAGTGFWGGWTIPWVEYIQ